MFRSRLQKHYQNKFPVLPNYSNYKYRYGIVLHIAKVGKLLSSLQKYTKPSALVILLLIQDSLIQTSISNTTRCFAARANLATISICCI